MIIVIGLGLACLLAAGALDYALVRHQQAVAGGRAHAAGRWSVACYAAGMVVFLAASQASLWYAVPSAAGYYIGSVAAVRRRPRGGRVDEAPHERERWWPWLGNVL